MYQCWIENNLSGTGPHQFLHPWNLTWNLKITCLKRKLINHHETKLVGGWTSPSEKYYIVKSGSFPQGSGVKIKKWLKPPPSLPFFKGWQLENGLFFMVTWSIGNGLFKLPFSQKFMGWHKKKNSTLSKGKPCEKTPFRTIHWNPGWF